MTTSGISEYTLGQGAYVGVTGVGHDLDLRSLGKLFSAEIRLGQSAVAVSSILGWWYTFYCDLVKVVFDDIDVAMDLRSSDLSSSRVLLFHSDTLGHFDSY